MGLSPNHLFIDEIFHDKPTTFGYPHSRKPPYVPIYFLSLWLSDQGMLVACCLQLTEPSNAVQVLWAQQHPHAQRLLGLDIVIPKWRFPEMGLSPNHPFIDGIFHYKPSILGTPIYEPPISTETNNYLYYMHEILEVLTCRWEQALAVLFRSHQIRVVPATWLKTCHSFTGPDRKVIFLVWGSNG